MMEPILNIHMVAEFIKTMVLDRGGINPIFFLVGQDRPEPGVVLIEGKMPPPGPVRHAAFYEAGRETRQEHDLGPLEDVYYASEAWMLKTETPEAYQDYQDRGRPIAEHPDRVEVFMVSHVNIPSKKEEALAYEMIRRGGTLDFALSKQIGLGSGETNVKVESYLIQAFIKGYQGEPA